MVNFKEFYHISRFQRGSNIFQGGGGGGVQLFPGGVQLLIPYRNPCNLWFSININPSLVLVQPKKTHPFITERLLMECKESNQTNKRTSFHVHYYFTCFLFCRLLIFSPKLRFLFLSGILCLLWCFRFQLTIFPPCGDVSCVKPELSTGP